eukprot:Rhum_TRINITY_DN7568_c0_g1::Rhum_TRINITY_DN7568_c0_g1_i1::g.23509::m.23509
MRMVLGLAPACYFSRIKCGKKKGWKKKHYSKKKNEDGGAPVPGARRQPAGADFSHTAVENLSSSGAKLVLCVTQPHADVLQRFGQPGKGFVGRRVACAAPRHDRKGLRRCLKGVRQVQNGAGVAAVHDGKQPASRGQLRTQPLEEVVVRDLACGLVVFGHKRFVEPVFLVAVRVLHLRAVTREVEHADVAGLHLRHQPVDGCLDLRPRRVRLHGQVVVFDVDHDLHAALRPPLLLQVLLHRRDVVRRTRKLPLLVRGVVDADEQRMLVAHQVSCDGERVAEVRPPRRGQHRTLPVPLLLEVLHHLRQHDRPRGLARLVRLAQQRVGHRTAGATRPRHAEAHDVGDVARGLLVSAAAEHVDVRLAGRLGEPCELVLRVHNLVDGVRGGGVADLGWRLCLWRRLLRRWWWRFAAGTTHCVFVQSDRGGQSMKYRYCSFY